MTIGRRNPAKWTGDLTTRPVLDTRHWNVKFDGFVQNGNLVPNTNGVATLDTGTSFIIGPYQQAAAFWAGVPSSIKHRETSAPYDVYEYPCNSKFTTALRLNGTDFNVSPNDYNVKYLLKGGLCLGFVAGGPFETWIVGDSFLKNWYTPTMLLTVNPPFFSVLARLK